MILFQNARLISFLSGGADGPCDVAVSGKHIRSVVPAGTIAAGKADKVIPLEGRTLLPGMFDLHMHMYFVTDNFADLGARSLNRHLIDSISYLNLFLMRGYTTVRDCGNSHFIGVTLRDAIAEGIIKGPRVFAAGTCISPTAKGNDTFPDLYTEVDRPENLMGAARREYSQGVDFLKYMATGSVANDTGEPGACVTTPEELSAIVEAAKSLGTYVAAHCHGTAGILHCIRAGVKTIEHASFLTEECIRLILETGSRTALVPTLSPVCELYEDREGTAPPHLKAKVETMFHAARMLPTAGRAGVPIGWGTDSSMKFSAAHPGYEFYARKQAGFSAEEMLRQATIESAEILGLSDRLGTIETGKLADLIVLEDDPLSDITAATEKAPVLVMKEGEIVCGCF